MITRFFAVLTIFCISLSVVGPIQAQAINTPTTGYYMYKSEILQLNQTVLGTTYIANLSRTYDYITQIKFVLLFTTTNLAINDFADGTPLTNGIKIVYNNSNLIDNHTFRTNEDIMQYTDRFTVFRDDRTPVDIQIQGVYDYLTDPLYLTDGQQLQFYVQDNITTVQYPNLQNFFVYIAGYKFESQIPVLSSQFEIYYDNQAYFSIQNDSAYVDFSYMILSINNQYNYTISTFQSIFLVKYIPPGTNNATLFIYNSTSLLATSNTIYFINLYQSTGQTQSIQGQQQQNPLDQINTFVRDNSNILFGLLFFAFLPLIVLLMYRRIKNDRRS